MKWYLKFLIWVVIWLGYELIQSKMIGVVWDVYMDDYFWLSFASAAIILFGSTIYDVIDRHYLNKRNG